MYKNVNYSFEIFQSNRDMSVGDKNIKIAMGNYTIVVLGTMTVVSRKLINHYPLKEITNKT